MNERNYSSWLLQRVAIGDTARLRFGWTTMGRHSSSNIRVLVAAYVSRHHAKIEVSDNDENVTIQDVSCNGIYVNEKRYDKATVKLKHDDLIGIGVSPIGISNDAEYLKLPIYQLKYAPIKGLQIPNSKNILHVPTSNPAIENNNLKTIKIVNGAEKDGNSDRNVKETCGSNNIKVEKSINDCEIFEISDDDDELSSKKDKKLVSDINKQIDLAFKTEACCDIDYINPSQRSLEKKSDGMILNIKKDEECGTSSNSNQATNDSSRPQALIPLISSMKMERLRSVSADIQNIFGDIEGHEDLQNAIKEINPLVYNEINQSTNMKLLDANDKGLHNGDIITLTDDEDLDELEVEELGTIVPNIETAKNDSNVIESKKELRSTTPTTRETKSNNIGTVHSPNVFESSIENSKEELNVTDENQSKNDAKNADDINLDEYTKYVPGSDDEDIEDLMFSQVIINDMKAELQSDINCHENIQLPKTNDAADVPPAENVENTAVIKQEPGIEVLTEIPKELRKSCWIISDDEDYDEELETKVNDWSNKIFSQSFNMLSQNMSQIYDVETENIYSSGEDDYLEDDDLSLLEDDIDSIATIYNNIEDRVIEKNLNSTADVNKKTKEQESHELNHKQTSLEIDKMKNEEIKQIEVSPPKESTVSRTDDFNNEKESPVVRKRQLKKHKRVIKSSSSSDDDVVIKNQKCSNSSVVPKTDKAPKRLLPPVISAPVLPKHKGKLRGVSADSPKVITPTSISANVNKKKNSVLTKIQQERVDMDLKKKWYEKSSVTKKREKEHKKFIKECRKDKLKEIAERKNNQSKESKKRKLSGDGKEYTSKVAKVKVTTHNRGAFLASNNVVPPPLAQFKIPKITKASDETKKSNSAENHNKNLPPRSISADCFETFSQQISKPDTLLAKRENSETKKVQSSPPSRRHSTTETPKLPAQTVSDRNNTSSVPICRESIAARAVRTTNKITFASMERNIVESEENKRKLNQLNTHNVTASTTLDKGTSTPNSSGKKKTVRFNDTPIIHYIERVTGACKKVINKDIMPLTTYRDRCYLIRSTYKLVDHTDRIISNILSWSNEWLIKRNAAVDAASEVIFPMPTYFSSFDHYKSIIFPLMKLEFVSTLEREYKTTKGIKTFKVSLDYATYNQDRIMLITKCPNNQNKEFLDGILYDLVILEADKNGPKIFAYVVANRKGAGSFVTIVYEIIAKNFTLEYFKAIREFIVRPVMDKVRVHFGAFNSVYQLESTPLFQKIINPLEMLKSRPPPKRKVIYRGFDKLNEKQKQVLLNTYIKIIDDSTPNMTLIQGPPGTGKSCVITNLVLQTLYGEEVRYLDKKILVCAQSNTAVDVIAGKLYDISMRMRMETRFRLIRYGMLNKIHPNVIPVALQKVVERDQLKKLQAKNENIQLENKENLNNQILHFEAQIAEMSTRNIRGTVEQDLLIEKKRQLQLMRNILNESMRPEDERSLFSWYLSNANIVCATLSSCVNLSQYINFFDICIIDEATQCTEPWTLLPLKFGINSLVLVGDTQQLPATVLSKKANELGLGTSMFTRIQQCLDSIPCTSVKGVTTPNSILFSLQTQYRMHPEICRWPNKYFYRNELINDKSTTDVNKSPLVPFSILSLTYTQNNDGIDGKITNNLEAEFVAKLLKALDGLIPSKYNSYGVITPYAHHRATLVSSIRSLGLTNIMVNTIDSYQGLEKHVIVISNARTNGIGFLSNPQRLNVALTRAKKCLILCGNFKILESVPVWRSLLENARERKLYHDIKADCMGDIQKHVIDKIKLQIQNQ